MGLLQRVLQGHQAAQRNPMMPQHGTPPNPMPRPGMGLLGGQPTPQQEATQTRGPGMFGGARNFLQDNSSTLIGLGAGILEGGLAGGPSGAFQGQQMDRERRTQTGQQNATVRALRQMRPDMSQEQIDALVLSGNTALLSEALRPAERPEQFTLAPGQVRYDTQGNEIARGAADPADAVEQQEQVLLRARGREDARSAIRLAAELENNEALPSAVGSFEGGLPSYLTSAGLPGGTTPQEVDDFRAGVERLGGQAFMQAREALKGGGQITDYEGQRAEAALINLNAAQSAEAYQRELRNFQVAIARGMILLEGREPTPEAVEAFIGEMTSGADAPGATGIVSQAQDAIQRGADPARVVQRLREAGYDPAQMGITAPQSPQVPGSLPPSYFQRGGA